MGIPGGAVSAAPFALPAESAKMGKRHPFPPPGGRNVNERYEFARDIARRAGEITLKYFQTGVQVEIKDDSSPVTAADRAAEEFLRGEIEKHCPGDGIIGEEFGAIESRTGRTWILDPIDGTKSFIHGVPLYGTLVALEEGGTSRIGVIRLPPLDITLSAMEGAGCFENGRRCHVSQTPRFADATVVSSSFGDIILHQGEPALIRLMTLSKIQRTWGDCYGYYMLATGRADAAVDAVVQVWDVAPLIPIVREAGGTITDTNGNEGLSIGSVAASNGILHPALLRVFQA